MRISVLTRPLYVSAALLALSGLSSCLKVIKPGKQFTAYRPATAPDYAQPDTWAALPTRRDSADVVPLGSGLRDNQKTAVADVFYVHPTTYYKSFSWNADLSDERLNRFTDNSTIRKQATVYNAAARVYAPRYRQATLYSFFDEKSTNGKEALDLAYSDVKAAFQYYLAHYNQGRPIIIAGHSQGTFHATRLLHEFFDHDPKLRKQLVVAYLIGFKVKTDEYQTLRPCQDSTQTGCYVGWNSVETGNEYPPFAGGLATNPLTWTLDTAAAPARLNRGGVPLAFNRVDTAVVGAQVHNGLLWINVPQPIGYPRFLLPGQPQLRHSFHIADYALFYLNLRRNAVTRVQAYTAQPQRP
ncbi:DUF3089 domain-containing protein [Hymenobacter chitinivorans]|uniref:DUF3089 family protein n=1 Tax=Hymenobacter chitinivorans DSM 11115 TaxID=1121954 RepID=A0A2M9B9Z8_9BACT|nr:DUF3089 domain-containing protein [Hymenobacter chitinivorans]PJJ54761.1 Protein of unknown function (DUF3089) [Hymenobacter chitinivorans DSM 11115]